MIQNEIAKARPAMMIPNIVDVELEADSDGDFKPIMTLHMASGRKFRIIIAEVT